MKTTNCIPLWHDTESWIDSGEKRKTMVSLCQGISLRLTLSITIAMNTPTLVLQVATIVVGSTPAFASSTPAFASSSLWQQQPCEA